MGELGVTASSRVIECGTGSGSLTHWLASVVSESLDGHLYTYEYHAERYEKALKEFDQHGMSECVTLTLRDVCRDGFRIDSMADGTVTAAFLDLPEPWLAILYLPELMQSGGRVCCFSPCLGQVEKTVAVMVQMQCFREIRMVECLE